MKPVPIRRKRCTCTPFMAIGRGCNSIAPVVLQYAHLACLTSAQKSDAYPIRSFVDEGVAMEALLYRLRKRNGKLGPTPYLDTLLAAFEQRSMAHAQVEERKQAQALPEPLANENSRFFRCWHVGLLTRRLPKSWSLSSIPSNVTSATSSPNWVCRTEYKRYCRHESLVCWMSSLESLERLLPKAC